ncbi:MAG: NAD-dependent epimerase/dehydratase family protein [Cyclobacteriaceae bacterium]|nr:NAD-dependent epimerase/dehydratase family protein [Cyclobacteriaceae bacterium]
MIAITGANGLLGSYILRKLVHEQKTVIALCRKNSDRSLLKDLPNVEWRETDILNPAMLQEAFQNVTTVIHTAAQVSFNPRMIQSIMEVNVEGTKNVVNTCLSQNIPRLIHISSVAALGRKKGMHEITETTRWIESDLNSDYAKSKYLSELEVWRGAEEGLHVTVINPSLILAPTDWSKSSAQLFQYVWKERRFYSETKVNYVDVRDVAEMVWQIYSRNIIGEKFIANAGAISIKALFDQIAQRFNKKGPSIKLNRFIVTLAAIAEEFKCRLTGGTPMITRQAAKAAKENFYFQNDKAVQELKISFKKLPETLDWCCEHYLRAYSINK